ncbi:MAG: hypothetical protein RLZZ65_237 [Bacteroidota bacterium]|jgi:hypothetical protein
MEARSFLQSIGPHNFEQVALETFERQYQQVEVYKQYVDLIGKASPQSIHEIPFLPISFFKTQQVLTSQKEVQKIFKSSGTTLQTRSQHFLQDLSWYDASYLQGFQNAFGPPEQFVFIALLPSYLENGDSSLVYMVDGLIKASKQALSGYYLAELNQVAEVYQEALQAGKQPFVFGVSYALLDLAELGLDLSDAIILETGGMKGRRVELTKEALHAQLCQGFGVAHIYSEYGMTELLSQAYCKGQDLLFDLPPWCQVQIRDVYDPFVQVPNGQKGGINFIDLANQWSCSFIQTDDLGRLISGRFSVEGRIEASDIRGCNLLVE